jgi:hypothetical protein
MIQVSLNKLLSQKNNKSLWTIIRGKTYTNWNSLFVKKLSNLNSLLRYDIFLQKQQRIIPNPKP